MSHHLVLLAQGRVCYSGPTDRALQYFQRHVLPFAVRPPQEVSHTSGPNDLFIGPQSSDLIYVWPLVRLSQGKALFMTTHDDFPSPPLLLNLYPPALLLLLI